MSQTSVCQIDAQVPLMEIGSKSFVGIEEKTAIGVVERT